MLSFGNTYHEENTAIEPKVESEPRNVLGFPPIVPGVGHKF